MLPRYFGWGAFMGKAQRFKLGLLYGVIAVLGAAYGVFQHQKAINWLIDSMKDIFPFLLLLIPALVVYGLFRAARSVRELLNGASLAALGSLQTNLRLRRWS